MQVVMLTGGFYPKTGGGAYVQWELAREIARRGHVITVFTPREDGEQKYEEIDEVIIKRPFRSTPSGVDQSSPVGVITRIAYSILITLYILRWSVGRNIDLVYSSSHTLHFPAKVLKNLLGSSLIQFIGYTPSVNPEEQSLTNILYLMEQVNFRFFMGDTVFCRTPEVASSLSVTSETNVELIDGILRENKIREATSSPVVDEADDLFISEPEGRLLIFVGRLVEIKNPSKVIDVLADLPEQFRLLVVGDGPERVRLQRRIEELNVESRVDVAGRLSHEETLDRIARADDLVLTSAAEAYPTVVFEALSLSTNVFAPPLGILPHVSHPNLYLGNPDSFVKTIPETDPPDSKSVDESVLEQYSIRQYTDRMLTEFTSLLD